MKFTDLFVKRPVLAIVVNLVILIAGLQSIRALSVRQYPRSDIAVVQRLDRLRRRQRRSRARVHHDAARARHRQRRRHRLHGVVERAGAQHDHGAPEAQLRHQRGADADPGEGRAGAQRSAARGGGADHRARDRRQPVRGDLSRLLVRRSRSEPDHRLPDARRAAEAERHQRRPARRHSRRADVRHAHLAEAGPDGGARHLAVRRCATRSRATTTCRRSDGPRARWCRSTSSPTPTCARPKNSGSSSSRNRTASSSGSARSPTSCSGAENYEQDVRFNGEAATFMGVWVLPTANSLEVIAQVRDGDSGDPGAAAGGHEGRHPVRLDRVHRRRHQRSAADADRDAADRHRRDLPVPRLVPLGAHPGRRDSDLARRRRVPDARRRASRSTC